MTKKIFDGMIRVIVLVLCVTALLSSLLLYRYFEQSLNTKLQDELILVEQAYKSGKLQAIQALRLSNRITVISERGEVLYDSRADIQSMDNHKDREEIVQSMTNGRGESKRYSRTLAEKTIYVAEKMPDGMVVRLGETRQSIFGMLFKLLRTLLLIFVFSLFIGAYFAKKSAKRIVEPINTISIEHLKEFPPYEELRPFTTRIQQQSDEIIEKVKALKDQQEKQDVLEAAMSEGLVIIDHQEKIIRMNKKASEILNTENLNQNVCFYIRSQDFKNALRTALTGKKAEIILNKDKDVYRVQLIPVVDDSGVFAVLILMINATEEYNVERLRQELTENISHEVKTPITSIKGYAEIMSEGLVKQEDIPKFSKIILREADRLSDLLQDIRDIEKIQKHSYFGEKVSLDLLNEITQVCEKWKAIVKEKDLKLSIIGETFSWICDRKLFHRVMDNLIDNAIKYNRPQGEIIIELSPTAREIRIKDTGQGISAESLPRIFERFYRSENARKTGIEGSGIGLAIVKHAVSYLGGKITCQSVLGEGTVFIIKVFD